MHLERLILSLDRSPRVGWKIITIFGGPLSRSSIVIRISHDTWDAAGPLRAKGKGELGRFAF